MHIDRCCGYMEKIKAYPCPKCGYIPGKNDLPYALRPGTILNGKYLVGKVLGQGGFGITYIGWDLQLERKVAIKEYFPSGCVSRKTDTGTILWYSGEAAQNALHNGQEMFLKEARKMSKVSGIAQTVQVFNVFQENETAYICMDFVEGHTLKDHLKKTGPLSWEQTKKIFLPVMAAMEQVHKAGLIHRDLSPDNLMLQPDGGVKILDLGAAKDLNLNTGKSSMQVAKSGFSPLEQYMQQGSSGTWTDVYALAATMYYTLTGVMPPSAIDRMDQKNLDWNLPRLQAVPPAAIEALKRAMTLRAAERTQTMADFSDELLKPKPEKPKKWLIPALAAAALAVVIFAAIGMNSGKSGETGAEQKPSAAVPEQMALSMDQWQTQIDELIDTCDLEIYNYQNGSRMEMYFDSEGRECLRIYVNTQGRDEFVFLAKYDADGNILDRYGFENQELMRATFWIRDSDGNAVEISNHDSSGIRLSSTKITYDGKGREVSRRTMDTDGNVTLDAASTYDASGAETYSGTRANGNRFVSKYDSDGKIQESTTWDAQGMQIYHSVYKYDSDGRQTEYLSYDENNVLTYRNEYQYTGDLRTKETSYSYYTDTEYVTEYEVIYGPRDVEFGRKDLDEKYGSITENAESMDGAWLLRSFSTYTGTLPENSVSFYNWDGDYLGYETYDTAGNLTYKSETLFNEAGEQTGTTSVSYYDDGRYSVSRMDENYNFISEHTYNSAGELEEETIYLYDESGTGLGSTRTTYEEDGSYTISEVDTSYNTLVSRTYDVSGNLVSILENSYDSAGMWAGSVSTYYYYDGSYMITKKDSNYKVVSQKTYDAEGNLVKSE